MVLHGFTHCSFGSSYLYSWDSYKAHKVIVGQWERFDEPQSERSVLLSFPNATVDLYIVTGVPLCGSSHPFQETLRNYGVSKAWYDGVVEGLESPVAEDGLPCQDQSQ